MTHIRPNLYGRKFTSVTDYKPLVWFQNSEDPCAPVSRWRLKLAEYDFDVVYEAGKMNVNADALSRKPIDNSKEESKHLPVSRPVTINIYLFIVLKYVKLIKRFHNKTCINIF